MFSPQQDDGLELVGVAAVDDADRCVRSLELLRQQATKLVYHFTVTHLNCHILVEAHCHTCLYLLAALAVSEPHEIDQYRNPDVLVFLGHKKSNTSALRKVVHFVLALGRDPLAFFASCKMGETICVTI